MNNKIMELEILEKAIDALRAVTNAQIDWEKDVAEKAITPNHRDVDARLTITLGQKELKYNVEIKATVTQVSMGILINRLRVQPEKRLLVAQYIPIQFAQILKEMEIPYIDTAGNVYINEPPIYIQIQGKRPERIEWPRLLEDGILGSKGLKVVFTLLCNNGMENATFREVAKKTEVALGTVDRVFKELTKRGNIIEVGNKKRRLIKRRELLDWWVAAYAERLRPKQLIGKFETDNLLMFQHIDLAKYDAILFSK